MKNIKNTYFYQRNLGLLLAAHLLALSLPLKASEVENLSTILHQLEQVSPQLRVDKASIDERKAGID